MREPKTARRIVCAGTGDSATIGSHAPPQRRLTMPTVQGLLSETAAPVIAMDQDGLVVFLNESFEKEYGWTKSDLVGRQLTHIIPPALRDAHRIGFSRFLATQAPTLLDRPLRLPIVCKGGRVREVEHLIVAEQRDGRWVFAARISPVPPSP